MTTTPKLCGTCKHIDSTKTTARELWVALGAWIIENEVRDDRS